MWCTRWFLPLLLLPLPTAPPYFLVLFLLTLALHARPCFYCIILLAALFLSSCYWQSFPLDANLSIPWADNITTFSDALNAAMPHHLTALDYAPPIVRVADRCWCDFTSGLFDPYDVQKWERDSIQRAVAHIESQWNQSRGTGSDTIANATAAGETSHVEPQRTSMTMNVSSIRNESLSSLFRSLFSMRSGRSKSFPISTPSTDKTIPSEAPTEPSALVHSIPPEPLLTPGQLDMRPFGLEIILDFRWSRRS